MVREGATSDHSRNCIGESSMSIYRDTISEGLGLSPLPQEVLARHKAEFDDTRRNNDQSDWGGPTWTKETFPDHPFVGGQLQKEKVKNGTHHLLNTVSCVGPQGDIILMQVEEYHSQSEYVHMSNPEAYIRRGLDPVTDRVTNLGKKMPLNEDAHQLLKGDNRTPEQKASSKEHSKRMKGRESWPEGRVFSDQHLENLRKPKKSMSFKEYKCPHCDKEGRGNSMVRWHMDNCKMKNN